MFIRAAEASSTESLALIILLMSNGVPKASLTKALTLQLLTVRPIEAACVFMCGYALECEAMEVM